MQVLDEQTPEERGDAVGRGVDDVGVGREVASIPRAPSRHRARHCLPSAAPDLERVLVAEHRLALHEAEELRVGDEPRELAPGLLDDERLDRRRAPALDLVERLPNPCARYTAWISSAFEAKW